jgi:hypothetical protein
VANESDMVMVGKTVSSRTKIAVRIGTWEVLLDLRKPHGRSSICTDTVYHHTE